MLRFELAPSVPLRFSVRSGAIRMSVTDAVIVPASGGRYDGPYEVVPKVEAQTLPTKQKYLSEDIHVLSVPFYEADNKNGTTIYIASEV